MEYVLHKMGQFGLGIVRMQTLHGTIIADKIMQFIWNLGFAPHRIYLGKFRVEANIQLRHGATAMARDPTIMCSDIDEVILFYPKFHYPSGLTLM